MRLLAQRVGDGRPRLVLDAELHLERFRPAEQLHGDELRAAMGRAHHCDADLRDGRLQHVGAVAG